VGRLQAQVGQRRDRRGAEQRVVQLEQRIGAAGEAGVQLGPELTESHQGEGWHRHGRAACQPRPVTGNLTSANTLPGLNHKLKHLSESSTHFSPTDLIALVQRAGLSRDRPSMASGHTIALTRPLLWQESNIRFDHREHQDRLVPYSIHKRQHEAGALGYVTARAMECVFIAVGILCMLAISTLRQDAPSGLDAAVGQGLEAVYECSFRLGPAWSSASRTA
jgi:hypothetical protein